MSGVLFWLCLAFILYVYAIYPGIVWLLARLFPRPVHHSRPEDAQPEVTILLAAYLEEASMAQKLENVLALEYPRARMQILAAVDGDADRTKIIVEQYAARGVEMDFSPQRSGKMDAINRAMPKARGEIVLLSDANASFSADALVHLVRLFGDPRVGAVSGSKRIVNVDSSLGESEGLYWQYESFIKAQESRLGSCTAVSGEILAFRRSLYVPAPAGLINDDFYIAMQVLRQGYRVVYAPEAKAFERVSPTAADEVARRRRIVAGRYQALAMGARILPFFSPYLMWQVISHKFFRPLVPFAMLGALLANLAAVLWPPARAGYPFLTLLSPFAGIFLALQAGFYGLAWLGGSIGRGGRLGKLLYLPAFLVNSNLGAAAGLLWFLTGRQSNLWQRVARRENL